MASLGEMDVNNPRDWFMMLEAAHQVLEASSGKQISKKMYLLANMGAKAAALARDILAPESISTEEVVYETIKNAILGHFKSQKLEMAERAIFYNAIQKPNETVASFFSRLKQLAEFCNFKTYLDDMLRDRMVLGCLSPEAKKKLLQMEKLTLKDVKDVLSVFEAMECSKHTMISEALHETKPERKHTQPRFNQKPFLCTKCGRNNCKGRDNCIAYGQKCRACGRLNHFAKVCRTRRVPFKKEVHAIEEKRTNELMHVETFPTHNVTQQVQMQINGKVVMMEIDTGASATLISERMWRKLNAPELLASNTIFRAYDGHKIEPIGEFHCTLQSNNIMTEADITVVPGWKDYGLLGRDNISKFYPMLLNKSINAVESVSQLKAMKVSPVKVVVKDFSLLRFCSARPVPLPLHKSVVNALKDLEKRGIITPVSSSPYASPVVWVKKRDGTLRMCADFKVHVNKAISSDSYPIPTNEVVFSGLKGSTYFAKIDLKEAYWQIPLDKDSRQICTINTTKGLYEFTRLPKGMKNSSAIFQRTIEEVLSGLKGVVIYQDDILIHGIDKAELSRRVSNVLDRLQQKDVTINSEKSILCAKEVKFLGHLVTSEGVKPDPDII